VKYLRQVAFLSLSFIRRPKVGWDDKINRDIRLLAVNVDPLGNPIVEIFF
jgi:hypothetical protein